MHCEEKNNEHNLSCHEPIEKGNSLTDVLIDVLSTNDPEKAVEKLATDISSKLNLNSISIYLATLVSGKETLVELYCYDQLYSSNTDEGDFSSYWEKRSRPIFSNKGICEKALAINSYLLGVDMTKMGVKECFYDKGDNEHWIQPSTLVDWSQTLDSDCEQTAIYIPFHVKDQYESHEEYAHNVFGTNAVVALRRNQKFQQVNNECLPFTHEEAKRCQPYVKAIAACCHHVVAVYDQKNDYRLLDELIKNVNINSTHTVAKSHLMSVCCEMQKASMVLMFDLIVDEANNQEIYFCTHHYEGKGGVRHHVRTAQLADMCIVINTENITETNRMDAVKSIFKAQLKTKALHDKLELLDIELPSANGKLLGALVYLRTPLKLAINYYHCQGNSARVDEFIDNFYRHMELYYLAYTRDQIRQVEEYRMSKDWSRLFKAVVRTTEADRCFLYLGDESQRELVAWVDNETGLPNYHDKGRFIGSKIEKDTLTHQVFLARKAIIIPDVNNLDIKIAKQIVSKRLAEIVTPNSIQDVLSWLAVPIYKGASCYGVIKLVTFRKASRSKVLTDSAIHLCSAFADYVYVQHTRTLRLKSIQDLSQMTNDISHISGKELECELISHLDTWTKKYLFAGCQIVVITHDMVGKLLHAHSPNVSDELVEKLTAIDWDNKNQIVSSRLSGLYYVAERIRLKSVKGFTGRLIIGHKNRFNQDHVNLIADIALDISMLIYQEFLRHQRRRDLATYRHAIVAPVQGLISKAKSAMLACKLHLSEEDFSERENELNWDSELIREWVAKTRLLGKGNQVTISKQYLNLIPLLRVCATRFEAFCKERKLSIQIYPSKRGNVSFYFDKLALDVAICNLLDNAVKYSFYNQEIKINYFVNRPNIVISVINIGHSLPKGFEVEYQQGKHFTWEDPFRVIPGEGYGVAIVDSIVKAHGGHVHFRDEAILNRQDVKAPFEVKATIVLPINH